MATIKLSVAGTLDHRILWLELVNKLPHRLLLCRFRTWKCIYNVFLYLWYLPPYPSTKTPHPSPYTSPHPLYSTPHHITNIHSPWNHINIIWKLLSRNSVFFLYEDNHLTPAPCSWLQKTDRQIFHPHVTGIPSTRDRDSTWVWNTHICWFVHFCDLTVATLRGAKLHL